MSGNEKGGWVMDVTDEDIDRYLAEAADTPPRPVALSATYNRDFDMIILRLDTGRRLLIPREEMQGLENATEAQLSEIEIHGGVDIAWPQLDDDHYLPYLIEGNYASDRWKQAREAARTAAPNATAAA
jgi:hypothetical protein